MNDKKIKIWVYTLVFSLMATGAIASFASQKHIFYKGINPLGSALQASALTSFDSKNNSFAKPKIKDAAKEKATIQDILKLTKQSKIKRKQTQKTNIVAQAPAPQKPAPAPTCEEKGSFTYTGPDRPGLLYGMCIACETKQFIWTNGKCETK